MGVYYSIDGADELLRMLSFKRSNFNSTALKCLKAALRTCAKQFRAKLPARWRSIVKSRASVNQQGTVTGGFGLAWKPERIKGHQSGDGRIPDWQKSYWINYGTLEGRDPSHNFSEPVKKGKRGQRGVEHQNFYEEAAAGWQPVLLDALQAEMAKRAVELLAK